MSEEQAYQITALGVLTVELMKLGVLQPSKAADTIWHSLAEFTRKRAIANGMGEGAPCLVLVDGGHCITAERGQAKEEGKAPIQADAASLQKQLLAEQERAAELVKLVEFCIPGICGNLMRKQAEARYAALSPPPVVGPRQD